MREFMTRLQRRGELITVGRAVDPKHELAAVTEKVQKTVNKPIPFPRCAALAFPS
jgi:UbiD family decarboxylase